MIQFRRIRYLVSMDKIDVSLHSSLRSARIEDKGEKEKEREEADKSGSDLSPRTTL
jgi:hypothetical protein